jgi:hypothetical protein
VNDNSNNSNKNSSPKTDDAVTISFSNHLVGGVITDTMVLTFRARWIVLNRSSFDLSIFRGHNDGKQEQLLMDQRQQNSGGTATATSSSSSSASVVVVVGAGSGQPHADKIQPLAVLQPQSSVAIETCLRNKLVNSVQIQCCESMREECDVLLSEKSPNIPIDHISEYNLNIRYITKITKMREFVVFRVSCYARTSVMFVVIDQMKNPPFEVENRTPYLVSVRQESSLQELLLYPFSTRGFVWEQENEPHLLEIDVVVSRNRVAKTALDLDPLLVVRRSVRNLKKDIIVPGTQRRVFIRTRAKKDTFCISLTQDRRIDSMLTRPFAQLRFDLAMQGLFVLVADTERDQRRNILLLSLPEILLSFAQGRLAEKGGPTEDVQKIEVSFGSLQLEKWREPVSRAAASSGTQTNIILSMLASPNIRKNSLVILRRKDRAVPVLHIRYLAVILQPLLVTVDDPFLEDILEFVDRISSVVSPNKQQVTNLASDTLAAGTVVSHLSAPLPTNLNETTDGLEVFLHDLK